MPGQPKQGTKGIVLSPGAARKIGGAASRVRKSIYLQRPQDPRGALGGWQPGILRAKVTTAIPTGTISVPSLTGKATIYRWDSIAETSAADGTDDFTDVRICNDMTLAASVPINTVIKVAWIDGDFWLTSTECY